MSRRQHDFKKWLVKEHVKADTPVGDLARDVRLDLTFPVEGGRRELRRYLQEAWGASPDFLLCFEEAWRLYEPGGSAEEHPFTTWLLRLDLRSDVPLSTFARNYANVFPAEGDRTALRAVLADYLGGDPDDGETIWNLTCFDVAWEQFTQAAAEELL